MDVHVNENGEVLCGWFALCTRPAAGVAEVGDGYAPICAKDAEKLGIEVIPAEFNFEPA